MIAEKFPEIAKLPIDEKRLLLSELCEDIASIDQESPDPRIVAVLEERWKAHERDPSGELTLEEFRKRIAGS
jgi:putative addiction module component (TIGR02574 family)